MKNCKNKSQLAKKLGIARSTLYYKPKKPKQDKNLKEKILEVQKDHPAYGHKRIALELGINKKRILRVMKLFNIHPSKIRKRPEKSDDIGIPPSQIPNIAKTICPIQPHVLWAGDFTYLPWHGRFVYVATVIDICTRKIVGVYVGLRHTSDLVEQALLDAIVRTGSTPMIFHSDQGSEYRSYSYELLLKRFGIRQSHSHKASPWQNPFQESFYNNFKLELGDPKQFTGLGELTEAVLQQIHYYIHKKDSHGS